jgi:predicted nucleotidyltransferase
MIRAPILASSDALVRAADRPAWGRSPARAAELERILGRPVDLVNPDAIVNPYVLASINRAREPVYGA